MSEGVRGFLTLLVLLLIAGLAFLFARHWQSLQADFVRVDPPADCDLHAGPCRQVVAGGRVSLAIVPNAIPLMQPLKLQVQTEGLAVRGVVVEIRGLNMDMGLNRTQLAPAGADRWDGETILPICSQNRMNWEAAVRLDGERRFEVPFLFDTARR